MKIEPRYRVDEVAEMLRESRKTVLRGLRRGLFKGAYKGGSGGSSSPWIIPESAVEAYLKYRRSS